MIANPFFSSLSDALNPAPRLVRLVEATQVTVRSLPEWRSRYFHLMMLRGQKIAKVAKAHRLAVRLYWRMRQGSEDQRSSKFGSYAGQPGHRHGVR